MKLSRTATNRINRALDDWLPPKLRDSRAAAWAARRMYGDLPIAIDVFKDRAFELDRAEYTSFYRTLDSRFDQGCTDLTKASHDAVLDAVTGPCVLDVACGKGYLAAEMARRGWDVIGCDVAMTTGDRAVARVGMRLCEGFVEDLPFRDGAFDTVVSTHTLEHVQKLARALGELRRVAKRRLVIVVPRQRAYRVTFNPHVHFFPYRWSLLAWTGAHPHQRCELVGGDWLYVEDR